MRIKGRSIWRAAGLLIVMAGALIASGCSAQATASPDPALVRFVVGTWVHEVDSESEYRLYTFESGTTAWVSTGEDGSQCTYAFARLDVIRMDCDGEARAVSVRRDGESLWMQELDERLSPRGEQMRFERVQGG